MQNVIASGTLNPTIGEEHVLSDIHEAGSYQLYVDTSNLAAGDYVEVRAYLSVLAGSTPKVVYVGDFTGAQDPSEFGKQTQRISNELEAPSSALRFTLAQRIGTSRAFDWKVTQRGYAL